MIQWKDISNKYVAMYVLSEDTASIIFYILIESENNLQGSACNTVIKIRI